MRLVLWFILSFGIGASGALAQGSAAPQSDDWPPARMNEFPVQLCGIQAFGPQVDLDRIKNLARQAGFLTLQMNPPDAELGVVFPDGTDPSAAEAFAKRLKSAEFASVAIKTICTAAPF
jgi:hypothetical protein